MSCRPDPSTESKCEGCSLNEIMYFFFLLSYLFRYSYGRDSPSSVSSLLREQLLTHTCLSNVYRSCWGGGGRGVGGAQPGEFRQIPALAKTLQCFDGQENRRSTNLVLLGGRVMFADPGGSCGPLSE